MSTFRGFIKEFPKILVDYFENPGDVSLFFLSHCHTDHMVGISGLAALKKAKLVVSKLTGSILTSLHPQLKDCLDIIEIGNEKIYTLENGETFLCTAVPAGHCPGSIGFYFQTETVNVFYSGDFRWRNKDLGQLKILQSIKRDLDAIYVDSTFLLPQFNEFPDQRESVSVVQDLVKEWLDLKPDLNRVFLEIPARFGLEILLLELYRRLGLEMHLLNVDQGCLLPFIPEMRQFIVPQLTHQVKIVVGLRNSELNPKFKWRTIKPSAMFWQNWKKGDSIVQKDPNRKETYRICYSSHSSCTEVMAVLKLLQPKRINLNVIPGGREDQRWEQVKVFKPKQPVDVEKKQETRPKSEQITYSFAAGYVPPPDCDRLRYEEILKEIMGDDSDEEDVVMNLPIRKRIKVDE